MKNWKRINIIMLGVLFFMAGIGFAQPEDQPPQAPSASDMISRMQQELNLTEEQVAQITPVIEDEINQMQSLMSQGGDRDASKVQMDTLRQATETKLAQYLTPEQLVQWKSKQQQPPQEGGDKMGPPPGAQEGAGAGQPPEPMGESAQ